MFGRPFVVNSLGYSYRADYYLDGEGRDFSYFEGDSDGFYWAGNDTSGWDSLGNYIVGIY